MKRSDSPTVRPSKLVDALRGPARSRETRRFFKFLAVGAISFGVETAALSALVLLLSMDRLLAKGIAFSLAVLSNFLWNRFWTYPESRSKRVLAQALQFSLLSVVGLLINLAVFATADRLLLRHFGNVPSLYAAHCAAVAVALAWNFVANRLITYGDVKLGR